MKEGVQVKRLKRYLVLFIIAILTVTAFFPLPNGTFANGNKEVSVVVNGAKLELPFAPPMIKNRILVPFRAIGESLGVDVKWNQQQKQVTAKDGDKTIVFTIGSNEVVVNGVKQELDTTPILEKSRTLLPLRFFSEQFQAEVKWDQKNRVATVNRTTVVEPELNIPKSNLDHPNKIYDAIVKASTLNVRSDASTGASVVGSLKSNEKVAVLDINGNWAMIDFLGHNRYVHSQYLELLYEGQNVVRMLTEPTVATNGIRWKKVGSGLTSSFSLNGHMMTIQTNATELVEPPHVSIEGVANIQYELINGYYEIYLELFPGYHAIGADANGEIYIAIMSEQDMLEALVGKKIFIDAGHGGNDPGAVANNVVEKEVVLDISLRVQQMLESAGATVVMTRTNDTFYSLNERVERANRDNVDAFVSIHANAAGNSAAKGSETFWNNYYAGVQSKLLAEKIQAKLVQKLNTVDRGVKQANFYVIKNSKMPSVLVEVGFLTNVEEAQRIQTNEFRQKSAEAIVEGLVEYFQ